MTVFLVVRLADRGMSLVRHAVGYFVDRGASWLDGSRPQPWNLPV
jgi:hypothetical protein